MKRFVVQCSEGALAGLAATVPMTLVMLAAQSMIPWWRRFELPPKQITEEAIRQSGQPEPPEPWTTALTTVNHFGYGALIGACYRAAVDRRGDATVSGGIAYGLGIWAASYLGWLPAAGLYPAATRDLPERNAFMLTAHVVWGASFSMILRRLTRLQSDSDSTSRSPAMSSEMGNDQARKNQADSFTIIYKSKGHDAETLETGLSESQAAGWLKRQAKAIGGTMSDDLIVSKQKGSESWQAVRAE
jgi:hypothetical protein